MPSAGKVQVAEAEAARGSGDEVAVESSEPPVAPAAPEQVPAGPPAVQPDVPQSDTEAFQPPAIPGQADDRPEATTVAGVARSEMDPIQATTPGPKPAQAAQPAAADQDGGAPSRDAAGFSPVPACESEAAPPPPHDQKPDPPPPSDESPPPQRRPSAPAAAAADEGGSVRQRSDGRDRNSDGSQVKTPPTGRVSRNSKQSDDAPRRAAPLRAGKARKAPAAEQIDINKSRVRMFNVSHGDHTIITDNLTLMRGPEEASTRPPEKSLAELTVELPERNACGEPFTSDDANPHYRTLRQEHLLFISCPDASIARAAAHAVIDALGLPRDQARLLDFDRLEGEGTRLTVYDLVKQPGRRNAEVVVVVDAVSQRAQTFLDSLLEARGAWSADGLKQSLKQNQLLVICVADQPHYAWASRTNRQALFANWPVPFLQPLLRKAFPADYGEVERRVSIQRESGRWSRHDGEFCSQLRSCLAQGRLETVIEAGGFSVEAPPPAAGLIEDRPAHNLALYVATFFEGLSPADFDRVVTILAKDERVAVTVPVVQTAADGTQTMVATQKEKELALLWREGADRILNECRLVAAKDQAAGRSIAFVDPGRREQWREHFEAEHGFYLHTRFARVHSAALLFDASGRVAESVVQLTIDMMVSYHGTYGTDWLLDVLTSARAAGHAGTPLVFERFASVLRSLWKQGREHASLVPIANGVLERLIATAAYGEALELIRHLRHTPGLDEFQWVRQLIDRGDEPTRSNAYRFLYREVMKSGLEVYRILHEFRSWLPPPERDPRTYSPSHRLALRLLVEYALDTVARFDPADYGAWPSRYPLFATANAEVAAKELQFLAAWLLHPGMPAAVYGSERPESADRMLAALVAEWTFILCGRPPRRAAPGRPNDTGNGGRTIASEAYAMLTTLLTQIAGTAIGARGRDIRQAMVGYWEEMKAMLALLMEAASSSNRSQYSEFAWRRELLRELLICFRKSSRDQRPVSNPGTVV